MAKRRQIAKRKQIKCHPQRIAALELEGAHAVRQTVRPATHCTLHGNAQLSHGLMQGHPEAPVYFHDANATTVRKDFKRHRLAEIAGTTVEIKFHSVRRSSQRLCSQQALDSR